MDGRGNTPEIALDNEEGNKNEEKTKTPNLIVNQGVDQEAGQQADKDEKDQDKLANRTTMRKPTFLAP